MIPPYMPSRYSEVLGYYAGAYPAGTNKIPLRLGGTARALDPPGGASHIAISAGGSGYVVGQIISLKGGAIIKVTSVNAAGGSAITGATIIFGGGGYTVGQSVGPAGPTATGSGFGGVIGTVTSDPYKYNPITGTVS